MSQLRLIDLPDCIFSILLQGFLSPDDYAQLLNTSKKHFGEIKRSNIIYSLKERDSLKYCTDEILRQRLLGNVIDPARQIKLQLRYGACVKYKDIFDKDSVSLYITHINPADWSRSFLFSGFKRAEVKDIEHSVDLSSFDGVETLNLSCTNLSLPQSCVGFTLMYCDDALYFKRLRDVKSLTLVYWSHYMMDSSGFHQLLSLELDTCPNIVDVSPLRGIRTLVLRRCSRLADISSLGDHHELYIEHCSYKLKGYEILRTVENITLCMCDITDLSALSHAKSVRLRSCYNLTDVSPLANVKSVSLAFCIRITDISSLASVHSLSIESLQSLTAYNGIDGVKSLSVLYDGGWFPASVPSAQEVTLCKIGFGRTFITQFTNLRKFTISSVLQELTIVGCEDIHEVVIDCCSNLRSIAGLGRNRIVRLIRCQSRSLDVSSLSNVPIVTIIYCEGINDLSCLKNVPRLKVL